MARLGGDAKLYIGNQALAGRTTTDVTDVTWTEFPVTEVSENIEKGEADVTDRESFAAGWEEVLPGIKKGNIGIKFFWKIGNAVQESVRAAWLAGTPLAVAVMSGDITTPDEEGLVANMVFLSRNKSQPLLEGQVIDLALKPTSMAQYYVVPTP